MPNLQLDGIHKFVDGETKQFSTFGSMRCPYESKRYLRGLLGTYCSRQQLHAVLHII